MQAYSEMVKNWTNNAGGPLQSKHICDEVKHKQWKDNLVDLTKAILKTEIRRMAPKLKRVYGGYDAETVYQFLLVQCPSFIDGDGGNDEEEEIIGMIEEILKGNC
jgi:hypothetical protein